MADDLEAFLRQAAQRRVQRQQQAVPKPPTRPPGPAAGSGPHRAADAAPRRPPTASPAAAADRVSSAAIQARAEHLGSGNLGQEVALAGERIEARVHQEFDHKLGELAGRDAAGATNSAATPNASPHLSRAAELAQLLRDPRSLRQAILLTEILPRPTQRW